MSAQRTLTVEQFHLEGRQRFGDNPRKWRFVCPSCGHVASAQDWIDAGAPQGAVAFSCVGRWLGEDGENTFRKNGGPCNYAGGGLFGLNPWTVEPPDAPPYRVFAFAENVEAINA